MVGKYQQRLKIIEQSPCGSLSPVRTSNHTDALPLSPQDRGAWDSLICFPDSVVIRFQGSNSLLKITRTTTTLFGGLSLTGPWASPCKLFLWAPVDSWEWPLANITGIEYENRSPPAGKIDPSPDVGRAI